MRDQWASLRQYAGKFVQVEGDQVVERDTPAENAAFPIRAGQWPNTNIGARQARCDCCKEFVGISPRGWELHRENPTNRPILCGFCFDLLMEAAKRMERRR